MLEPRSTESLAMIAKDSKGRQQAKESNHNDTPSTDDNNRNNLLGT